MTFWTILYYIYILDIWVNPQHVRFQIFPDRPIVVRNEYNHKSLWLSSPCERASFKCKKLRYVSAHTRRNNFTFFVGIFNQIHYLWCHKTDTTSLWHNINGTWMSNATLFQTTVACFLWSSLFCCFSFRLYII